MQLAQLSPQTTPSRTRPAYRSVSATDQGVLLLERLNRAWAEIEDVTQELAARRQAPAGTFG